MFLSFSTYANSDAYCLGYFDAVYKEHPSKQNFKTQQHFEKKVKIMDNISKEYYSEGAGKSNNKLNNQCIEKYKAETKK